MSAGASFNPGRGALERDPGAPVRQRRSHSARISTARRLNDWVALFLLSLSPLLGAIFFGANRLWSIAPFMICIFIAWILILIRPFWDEESQVVRLPPGIIPLGLFSVYGFLHIVFGDISYEARADWLIMGSGLAAYWTWTELTPRLKRSRFLVGTILAFSSGLAWYAIIQHTQGSTMTLWIDTVVFYEDRARERTSAPIILRSCWPCPPPSLWLSLFLPALGWCSVYWLGIHF